ncbi:hypothetical protein [Streptomyces sp. XC 2026]|uniref:hypothetical protein n=1 Tax=Streptomyces sp. XC 2026 TaxID=2782004 RepID=UPI00190620D3|nr:hypothetical protein [Streptomyces sp. XC 2026]QQN79758.1 hypothetical protein IPZ77_21775 [Streptomyces sp. XC 2026]QQN80634.1 hypothetical protein IPZ77_26880 [Streptomyces sp. XC 2026]
MTTLTPVPLPRLGMCPMCGRETKLRTDGVLHQHRELETPESPIRCDPQTGLRITTCPGSGRPAEPLEPTFLRWVWAHRARRDARTNRVTMLAEILVGTSFGCGRDNRIDQVPWTTAAAAHSWVHARPATPSACTWVCEDIATAGAEYDRLYARHRADLLAALTDTTAPEEDAA